MRTRFGKTLMYAALLALMAPLFGGCGSSSSNDAPPVALDPGDPNPGPGDPAPVVSAFRVTDTAGDPVEGATVFAIPVADVEALGAVAISRDVTKFGDYSAEALTVDEPLEDLINGNFSGSNVASYKQAVTGADGKAEIADLPTGETDRFFLYVRPATEETHLPGGSLCRDAVAGTSLEGSETPITLSTKPSPAAVFVGSTTCLVCHPDKTDVKKTMHKNGFMAPGSPSFLQNTSRFDGDDAEYNMTAAFDERFTAEGTTVYFYDYDAGRKFDKFKTSEANPDPDGTVGNVWATARVFKDAADGKYKMEVTNVKNPADPRSPFTMEVALTYGGGIYKQRYLTVVGNSVHMLPLQYNQRGDDASADRVRKQWRDYHLDWWVLDPAGTPTFRASPANNNAVDIQCAPCHFNGFSITQHPDTGEFMADGVADLGGEVHPVTGERQELNIGCETCHGPGSEHAAALGKGKAIVSPQNLPPERESMICGQCHSRPQGNDSLGIRKDSPLDPQNKMMVAGISRADFLVNHTSRNDSDAGDMWGDGLHSKSHHQQYTDFIQTTKYRNGSKLLTCASCHDLHAPGTDRHQLSGVSDNTLCTACHTDIVIADHQSLKPGIFTGLTSKCVDCHITKTSTSGAGLTQTADEALTGGTSGAVFLHGDISSHLFAVPDKSFAPMPVPYTNKCGVCHNVSAM